MYSPLHVNQSFKGRQLETLRFGHVFCYYRRIGLIALAVYSVDLGVLEVPPLAIYSKLFAERFF